MRIYRHTKEGAMQFLVQKAQKKKGKKKNWNKSRMEKN